MTRTRCLGVPPLVLCLSLLGCGAPGDYDALKTSDCLRKAGAAVSGRKADGDGYASGGRYTVTLHHVRVDLAFARDDEEAKQVLAADEFTQYQSGPPDQDNPLPWLVEPYRRKNIVVLWIDDPGTVRSVVEGCLR